MKEIKPLEFYKNNVDKMILSIITQSFINTLPASEITEILWRIFHKKNEIIINLAKYVKNTVEINGKDINEVLEAVSFFAFILKDYAYKNIGQPIKK